MSEKYALDFNFCNQIVKDIVDRHGHNTSAKDLPEKERTVVIVWTVSGIIENGGFHYLFEGDLPGDPFYEYTLEAFAKIACDEAFETIRQALCLFQDCTPPDDNKARVQIYESFPQDLRDKLDTQFVNSLDALTICLAEYIRANKIG